MGRVEVTAEAERDLLRIADELSDRSRKRALEFVGAAERAWAFLEVVPEFGAPSRVPSPHVRVFPADEWLLLLREKRESVEVLRIVHGRQDLRQLRL